MNRFPQLSVPIIFLKIIASSTLALTFAPAQAFAFRLGVASGAIGVGTGQSNAADFASPVNLKGHAQFASLDLSFAATQLLLGKVFTFNSGAYVIPALGFIVDGNGSGPGVGTSFGFNFFCWGLCPYVEMQHLLGVGPRRHLASGYAVRLGIDYNSQSK